MTKSASRSIQARVVRQVWRLGWRLGPRLPKFAQTMIIHGGSAVALCHNGQHVRTLTDNLTVASGGPVDRAVVRQALASYLRNFTEVLALPGWSAHDVIAAITTSNEHYLREAFAGSGAIVALPHSGNWDLAGAWACLTGMPVSTVAEQLSDSEFQAFVQFRTGLGMRVLSHRDPKVISELATDIRAGRLICLVADRDLAGRGVSVDWWVPGSVRVTPITMPGGPALLARLTGAALIPAVCSYRGTGMHIAIGAPVVPQPGREGLTAMTQQVADFFAARIAAQPQDWHMLQPFFRSQSAQPVTGHSQ